MRVAAEGVIQRTKVWRDNEGKRATRMSEPHATPYDEVEYPSAIFPQTHPDRLAVHATLFGMRPADVDRCRVLELGCGDGSNLIAMACALPGSTFLGVDLSGNAIQKGQDVVGALGLRNVSLRCLDLLDFQPDGTPFDYVIAHGLYSWVPAAVRDRLLAICEEVLAPQGVAYVSYNAYPGNHTRDLARGMMRYHVARFDRPAEQIRQARGLLDFLAEVKTGDGRYSQLLVHEAERIRKYLDAAFFHDDLSAVNHSAYFHEFAAHAARHGLQYLSEADIGDMVDADYPSPVAAVLRDVDACGDRIASEQYRDFIKCRAFRQTLLCRREAALEFASEPVRLQNLFVAADVRPSTPQPDLASDAPVLFHGPKGSEVETAHPLVKAAFSRLGRVWPQYVLFNDLLVGASEEGGCTDDASKPLGEALWRAYRAGFVELHAHAHPFAPAVSEKPAASPLARLQLKRGTTVATLRHTTLRLDDGMARLLVSLLDGTRDRTALLGELSARAKSGDLPIGRDGRPFSDVEEFLRGLPDGIERNLTELARAGVLVA